MPNQVPERRPRDDASAQLDLLASARERRRQQHPTWGGRREGAGRKPAVTRRRPCVPHVARPRHSAAHPVHVTLRARRDAAFLRSQIAFSHLREALCAGQRPDFRVVHYSVQRDHVHLLVEAHDRRSLASGMQGLAIRLARAVNRSTRAHGARGRRGKVWAERYHRHDLRSPREVRNALVYVLQNRRKHARRVEGVPAIDPRSSAAFFDGWTARAGPLLDALPATFDEDPPVVRPRTWLLREGWRRGRLIDPAETPARRRA